MRAGPSAGRWWVQVGGSSQRADLHSPACLLHLLEVPTSPHVLRPKCFGAYDPSNTPSSHLRSPNSFLSSPGTALLPRMGHSPTLSPQPPALLVFFTALTAILGHTPRCAVCLSPTAARDLLTAGAQHLPLPAHRGTRWLSVAGRGWMDGWMDIRMSGRVGGWVGE